MTPRTPREAAVSLLLEQRLHSLFIEPQKLRLPRHIIIDSMQAFCRVTNMAFPRLAAYKDAQDGFTLVKNSKTGPYHCILYNEEQRNLRRRSFTIAHELGHIFLGHPNDGDENESAANVFASELLMPGVLLAHYIKSGACTPDDVCAVFNVSRQAAAVRLGSFVDTDNRTDCELELLRRYAGLIPSRHGPLVTF
ncbi:MAG: ImmA/IrrE family metallo-endopeptidase [Oscillospiraceae bacterium]|jgi:hypothetical protein|nr:ImmA/IrrE family metallo-endopeptidase [Oscillospiraceae bacterium]